MSGGRFDYLQFRLPEIYEQIEQEIRNNNACQKDGFEPNNFGEETIKEFRRGIEYLKKAEIYAQRIDRLLEGDDGEDTFHERLKEDLDDI